MFSRIFKQEIDKVFFSLKRDSRIVSRRPVQTRRPIKRLARIAEGGKKKGVGRERGFYGEEHKYRVLFSWSRSVGWPSPLIYRLGLCEHGCRYFYLNLIHSPLDAQARGGVLDSFDKQLRVSTRVYVAPAADDDKRLRSSCYFTANLQTE